MILQQMSSGILSAIGSTPLIKLERLSANYSFNIYAKLEFFNPTGSIKDRAAHNILKEGLAEGKINHNTTVIECSSGNLALGLALICKYLNLKFICVIDPRVTQAHQKLLKMYGCQLDIISEPDVETGEFLPALINRVQEWLRMTPNSFWPSQHTNIHNATAHYQTMAEIIYQLNNNVDYVVCATSSCGTLRGCHDYIKKNNLNIKIYAVDAEGSKIFSKVNKKRVIPGFGAGFVPDLYHSNIECTPIVVSSESAVQGCHQLFEKEAILTGGSSGAIISAIYQVKDEIKKNSNCVAIMCDRGDRYLETIYHQEWVSQHVG